MLKRLQRELARLRWSQRKLLLPINRSALVLEIGSGGNPHPASDILLEKYVVNSHRLRGLSIDRPLVLADACRMPFRSKAFDYTIAFHVLEHVEHPSSFLKEISRVSCGGYIETPNALYERIAPLSVHLLEVGKLEDCLLIRKKAAAADDQYLQSLSLLEQNSRLAESFALNPEAFHVCHHWRNEVRFSIFNDEQSLDWFQPPPAGLAGDVTIDNETTSATLRSFAIDLIRKFYVHRKRRRQVDLNDLLVCPDCHADLHQEKGRYICVSCDNAYRATPVPDFTCKV